MFLISREDAQSLLDYLQKRPYYKVFKLINILMKLQEHNESDDARIINESDSFKKDEEQ